MNTELYKNKYRVATTRLKEWDYAANGYYYVTICTQGMELYFGTIRNELMAFHDIGNIADAYWQEIPKHHHGIMLDEYRVMPNHIHGIIVIHKCRDAVYRVSTDNEKTKKKFGPLQPDSLPSIINTYKGAVTRWCNRNGHQYFDWQDGFHDHIIRSERALKKIREYIRFNITKWNRDKYNKNHIKNSGNTDALVCKIS